jgi:superfamily I DNA/RNA helicase
VHADKKELAELLPADYRERHLEIAVLIQKLRGDEDLDEDELAALEAATGLDLDVIRAALNIEPDEEESAEEESRPEQQDEDPASPSILCTSLVGAKGLSAEHVFILSFVDGEFPRDPGAVTDDEICELIVGLSRTRKRCHLISCGRWAGGAWRPPSSFLSWLHGIPIQEVTVDKEYWKGDRATECP